MVKKQRIRIFKKDFSRSEIYLALYAIFLTLFLFTNLQRLFAQPNNTPVDQSVLRKEQQVSDDIWQSDQVSSPSSTSSSTTSTTLNKNKKNDLKKELYDLHLELAYSNYLATKKLEDFSELILAREKAVETFCLSKLQNNLNYKPNSDSQCLELITKLLEIDPNNPTAICARDGYDAKCAELWSKVTIETYRSDPNSANAVDNKLDESNKQIKFDKLKELIEAEVQKGHQKSDPSYKELYLDLYSQLLAISCNQYQIAHELSEDKNQGNTLNKKEAPNNRDEINLLGSTENSKSIMRDPYIGKSFKRKRLVNKRCAKILNELLEVEKKHPLQACYRFGLYSYQCLAERKRYNISNLNRISSTEKHLENRDRDIGKF